MRTIMQSKLLFDLPLFIKISKLDRDFENRRLAASKWHRKVEVMLLFPTAHQCIHVESRGKHIEVGYIHPTAPHCMHV